MLLFSLIFGENCIILLRDKEGINRRNQLRSDALKNFTSVWIRQDWINVKLIRLFNSCTCGFVGDQRNETSHVPNNWKGFLNAYQIKYQIENYIRQAKKNDYHESSED